MTDTIQRNTKYCQHINNTLKTLGHATNNELLEFIRQDYPELSATTIHRATTRMASRNKIAMAPSTLDGSMRYDNNIEPHDHFHCLSCGLLIDIDIKDKITPILKIDIDNCEVSGRLTISGICKKCALIKRSENENNNL